MPESTPLFVYGVVPSKYNHMEIAEAFWYEKIAWASFVLIDHRDSSPGFNMVYVEISGWLSDERGYLKSYQSYKNSGKFQTSMGTFRAVPECVSRSIRSETEGNERASYMTFPIQYYIYRPGKHYDPLPQTDEEIKRASFYAELESAWDELNAPKLAEETEELKQKRSEAYAGCFSAQAKERYISTLVMEHLAEKYLDSSLDTTVIMYMMTFNKLYKSKIRRKRET